MSDRTRHENHLNGPLHVAQAAAMPRTNRIAVKETGLSMLSTVDRHVIGRESNVVRVDFSRDPNPPAPCFPGARVSGGAAPRPLTQMRQGRSRRGLSSSIRVV